ncbi:MAG: D-Ala-D-Ala carboxypeptidase family metallohydrolase [Actinomycetota bacterium]|nr:D-Ala-D-Ala carboxypeptidase family metallohydrolase [Actinomycetota bacterium]
MALACLPSAALAGTFGRPLHRHDRGRDVKALEIRVAGWFSRHNQTQLPVNNYFGRKTSVAVRHFKRRYGLKPNGIAGKGVFQVFRRLKSRDGSTRHFDWNEFAQNANSSCGAQANAYAGTFRGGAISFKRVKSNVRRIMWRLEAVRAKGGANPVGINSGFRSVTYNDCIGGASASQHMYGTAADNRIAGIGNRRARGIGKNSQVQGIGCYSSSSHNHFDLRVENRWLPSSRYWWWPDRDSAGRDLDETGRPCFGETRHRRGGGNKALSTLEAVRAGTMGAGSFVPSAAEVAAFERAGEPDDLGITD